MAHAEIARKDLRETREQRRGRTEKRTEEEPVGATVPTVAPTANSRETSPVASLIRSPAACRLQTVDPGVTATRKGTTILKKRLAGHGKAGRRPRKERSNGPAAEERNVPLILDREELMAMLQECLTDFATEVGLKVACLLFGKQVDMSYERATRKRSGSGRRGSVAGKLRR